MSVKFSLSKAGLEVYTTEPMVKKESGKNVDLKKLAEKVAGDAASETKEKKETTDNNADPSTNFTLENGETKQIDYVGELYSDSYEMDYTEISSNSSVSVPIKYVNLFFKGKKVALKKAWQNGVLNWEYMETAILGFVTEFTWNKDKADIKISGMDKLMEVDYTFEFTQTKRSEVVKQIIEASGLKAKVDVTGLVDDVIDFKTSSESDSGGGGESTGSATVDEAVENAIKGKTSCLDKAKAIYEAFKAHVIYSYYFDCKYSTVDAAWKAVHLNCADGANVLCAMYLKAGLKAEIQHTPGEDGKGHYIVRVTCDGKSYSTDNAASSGQHTSHPFGSVWGPSTGSTVGTKIGG